MEKELRKVATVCVLGFFARLQKFYSEGLQFVFWYFIVIGCHRASRLIIFLVDLLILVK